MGVSDEYEITFMDRVTSMRHNFFGCRTPFVAKIEYAAGNVFL